MTRRRAAWAGGAVRAVAGHERRRHWRRLAVLGLAAGLLGAAVVGLATTARRTATAFDRLADASRMADATISVFGDPALADAVRALPGVRASSTATMFVGGVAGPGVVYAAVRASPPDGLGQAVLVEGRAPDPDDPDEVLVLEDLARRGGLRPGSTLEMCLLTREEFASFDTGFGAPDGPCASLRITGVGRVAGADQSSGIYAGPRFVDRYGSGTVVGLAVDVALDGGVDGLARLGDAVAELAAANPPPAGAEEFPSVALSTPAEQRAQAAATARVLVAGLGVCAVVAALVGLLLVGQALSRRFEADAADQQVEAALGLTPLERCLGRVLPATITAAVAALVTAGGALAAGLVEPLGPVGDLEPTPGWAPNLVLSVAGAVVVALAALALTAAAAWRAGRAGPRAPSGAGRGRRRFVLLGPGATTAAGLAVATGRGRGGGHLPARATVTTVVVGVAGVTAALTFAASLDRVGAEPSRWGWNADVVVIDARAETVAEVAADPRVGSADWLHQVEATVEGESTPLYAFDRDPGPGRGWTVIEGRRPTGADEIVLGPKRADATGVGVGDEVTLAAATGPDRVLQVVGLGLGPSSTGEALGDAGLVTREALDGARATAAFDELLVRAAAGQDADELVDDLAARYEVATPSPPPSVEDVLDLGRLPTVFAGYLGLVAVAALANGVAVLVRRRSRDLATLRTMGLTPGQGVGAVLVVALAIAAVGLAVGVPLGLGVGRLVWWLVADAVGLAPDVRVPLLGVVTLVAASIVVAGAAALVPARRAARLRPGDLLRSE